LDGVGQNFGGRQIVFLRLAFLRRVPESPQRRCRGGRSHHAPPEAVVENSKQFLQDRIGENALPFRVEQRQDDAKEIGVTFQAVCFETGYAEIFGNGMAQPIEPLAELVSWPLSCGPLPCLTLPSIPWCRPGRHPPELSSD